MEFWLGLMLSIPIALATNLVTPRIQKWLEASSKRKSIEKTKDLQAEYERILKYKDDPQGFASYLLLVVIRTTLIGSLVGILAGLAYLFPEALEIALKYSYPHFLRNSFYIVAQFFSLVGALMIVNICRSAIATWYKVNNFERYQKTVEETLAPVSLDVGRSG